MTDDKEGADTGGELTGQMLETNFSEKLTMEAKSDSKLMPEGWMSGSNSLGKMKAIDYGMLSPTLKPLIYLVSDSKEPKAVTKLDSTQQMDQKAKPGEAMRLFYSEC